MYKRSTLRLPGLMSFELKKRLDSGEDTVPNQVRLRGHVAGVWRQP